MAEPFLGELKLMSFNFPPKGWAFCNGQLLPINQNQPLFALLGTMYGGNGQTNFALPNLQGRSAFHFGNGMALGERAGEAAHTITMGEMPQHFHTVQASRLAGSQAAPKLLASANNLYGPPKDVTTVQPATISSVGGSQPHENRPPGLTLNWCIALTGIFPSQT